MQGLRSQFGLPLAASLLAVLFTVAAALIVAVRAMGRGQPVLVPTARVLGAGSMLVILTATALPYTWPPIWEGFGDLVLVPGRGGLSDWRVLYTDPDSLAAVLMAANVLLYVPLGLFGAVGWPARRSMVLVASLGLSLVVEVEQVLLLGRIASTDDVGLNMTGAVVGYLVGARKSRPSIVRRRVRSAA